MKPGIIYSLRHWTIVIGTALVLGFGSREVFQWIATTGLKDLVTLLPGGNVSGTNLIVVVHGYNQTTNDMADVRRAIMSSRPDAEINMMKYPAGICSNADCFNIASNLCEQINQRYLSKHYNSIEFVGYSMGALLARKAYLYACGKTEDMDSATDAAPRTRAAYAWATNGTVKRFVLLAGMNRGWTTRSRPNGMSMSHQFEFTVGKLIVWATGTGRLIRQCEQGEPFVANLRMQWLEANREMPPPQRPTVIQLLGDTDDIVSTDDSRDANVARDFIWVQLTGTGHANVYKFRTGLKGDEAKQFGLARERKFIEALGDEQIIQRLMRASPRTPKADDEDVIEAVIVLHGIRDFGEWTSEFEDELQRRFMQLHQNKKLCIYRPKYGYFPMGRFLLWPERQKKVRWFMDELTELQARYPNMKRLNFIGHSNGTYILASVLRKYKAVKTIKRVVFAGSVVPQRFNWGSPLISGVEGVRNYAGSKDWVVAWFPRLFEIWPFTQFGGDIGSAGFNGFTIPDRMPLASWTRLTNDFLRQTIFVKGGHGTAITPEADKLRSIASFVMDPEIPQILQEPDNVVPHPSRVIAALSWAAPLVWFIILVLLVSLGLLISTPQALPNRLKNTITTLRAGNLTPPRHGLLYILEAFAVCFGALGWFVESLEMLVWRLARMSWWMVRSAVRLIIRKPLTPCPIWRSPPGDASVRWNWLQVSIAPKAIYLAAYFIAIIYVLLQF